MPRQDASRDRIHNTGFWGWAERQLLLLRDDPQRRARAFKLAWLISTAFVLLGFAIIGYQLLAGQAAAAGVAPVLVDAHDTVDVTLVQAEDARAWTVTQSLAFNATGDARGTAYWLPADAQNQHVRLLGAEPDAFSFYLESDGRGRIVWDAEEAPTGARVQFTLTRPAGDLPAFRVPTDARALSLTLHLQPGYAPPADADWTGAGDAEAWTLTRADAAADTRVPLTPAAPAPQGGPPVLGVLAAFAVVALALGAAYSARRTPRVAPDADAGLLDHLRELQSRLFVVVLFLAAYAMLFFTMGVTRADVAGVSVPWLTLEVSGSVSATTFDVIAHQFVPDGVSLVVLRPVDAALTQLLVSLFLAFVATVPLAAYETGAFLGPALLDEEKKLARRTVIPAVVLFGAGITFAYHVIVPVAMRILYGYAGALGATALLTVNDLVGFSVILLLVFGLAFELPLVMAGLTRLGVVSAETFASKWRHAIVAIFLLGGILTPDPTWVTQVLLSAPLTLLYLLGVVAARAAERNAPQAA